MLPVAFIFARRTESAQSVAPRLREPPIERQVYEKKHPPCFDGAKNGGLIYVFSFCEYSVVEGFAQIITRCVAVKSFCAE